MMLKLRCMAIALVLWMPLCALALDNSSAVKVTPLLKTTLTWDGKPIVYPDGQAEITGLLVEVLPGSETGWHEHPVPSFGLVLDGALEITLKNGQVKRLHSGEVIAEVVDTLHNGRNVGTQPVKMIVFYAGTVGKVLTVRPLEINNAAPEGKTGSE